MSVFQILGLGLVIKIILGIIIPLSPDEAYYWVWSHHLQLSYFDHPPFVSWIYLMGQIFEGFGGGVRIPGILLGQLTILVWIYILKSFLDEKRLWYFTLLSQFMPFLGPAGLIITPDTPLMFFWGLAILLTLRLAEKKTFVMSLLVGFSLGLGFCSKYPIVLVLPVVYWILIESKVSTRQILLWSLGGFGGAIVTSSPVWVWNLTNELQSFEFQMSHGFGGGFRPKYFIDYLGAQLGLLFPTVVYFAWKGRHQAPGWLQFAAVWPLAFFGFSSFFSYAEANWPITAHPAFLALSVFALGTARWAKITIFIWAFVFLVVLSEALGSWLPQPGVRLKTNVLHKYDQVATQTMDTEQLFARTYQMASILSFKQDRKIYKLKGMNRIDFFDSLPQSVPQQKEFHLVLKVNEGLPKHLQELYVILKREPIDDQFDLALMKRNE